MNQETLQYIKKLLLDDNSKQLDQYVFYGKKENCPGNVKVTIVQSDFFDKGIYGTDKTLPKTPFEKLPESDTPFLFGQSVLEKDAEGHFVLHADLVASAFFLLSRYEEIIKPECRDQYGRFLAKDSIVFQQGYGFRPLVDEWGLYLRNLLRKAGVETPAEKQGFRKIYLTHDVDIPFAFYRFEHVLKQWIKNIIHRGKKINRPFKVYQTGENDSQNTFEKIVAVDTSFQNKLGKDIVESIYFLIAAGSSKTKLYCNIRLNKFQKLIKMLSDTGATLGLHVSLEAGKNPQLIKNEMQRLLKYCPNSTTKSRNHYLRWIEPEHIEQMERFGITEDYTLGYADSVGFRVGTCKPYYFINPRTKIISNVLEHPMSIMECSLNSPNYMGLNYDKALEVCKKLINETYKYNGELVLLFHNPIWSENNYYGQLYEELLDNVEWKKN